MERIHRQDAKTPRKEPEAELDRLAREVVDAAFRVHSVMGPGLLESIYEECLCHELRKRGVKVERQVPLSISYEGHPLEGTLRLDLLVEGRIILEIKAVEALLPIHEAQLLTYLKLSGIPLGFLLNFNVTVFKNGIRRRILS